MMVRRIEFLEEQSEKRAKVDFLENQEPYLREIEMLKSFDGDKARLGNAEMFVLQLVEVPR